MRKIFPHWQLKRAWPGLLGVTLVSFFGPGAIAQDAESAPPEAIDRAEDMPEAVPAEELATGPLSLVDIAPATPLLLRHNQFVFGTPTTSAGDITSRTQITGDWNGVRQQAVDRGVFFDVYSTTIFQGSFASDGDSEFGVSEHLDAYLNLDSGRLGWWPGGILQFTFQGKFGNDINAETGVLSPVNTAANWPIPDEDNVALVTEYYLTQFLHPQLLGIVGKFNPTSFADNNTFANDYRYQFQNFSLNNNLMLGGFVPEITWGAALAWQTTPWLAISTAVLDPNTSAENFADDFFDDITVSQEFAFKYSVSERPGNFRLGWLYNDREKIDLTDPVSLIGGDGILDFRDPFQTEDGSFMVYANFDQYFFTIDPIPTSTQDSEGPQSPFFASPRGLGAFGRIGFGPANTNIVNLFASAGIGGKGLIPGRPYDEFGLGWYQLNFSNDFEDTLNDSVFLTFLNRGEFDLKPENGIEIYYNAAITPAIQFTADAQLILEPGLSRDDTVLVTGGRLQLNF
ncbi:MAG: carbohydrate porin [Synechococcus sp.]